MCGGTRGREGESERSFGSDASIRHDDCSQNTVSFVKTVCATKGGENDKLAKISLQVKYMQILNECRVLDSR